MIKRILPIGFFLLIVFQSAYSTELLWTVEGLAQPESAFYDKARDRLIVSNINGHPTKADGNGFLSLVSLDGKIKKLHWVDKLDAPKGMALLGNHLLVADLNKVHVINILTGKIIESIEAPGAVLLNDISADDTRAWITDLLGNTIYVYEKGRVSIWLDSKALYHPNGILVDGEVLYVGTWGDGLQDDFTTDIPGGLLSINISTKKVQAIHGAEKIGNLDGVIRVDDKFIVNDWITGTVYKVAADGTVTSLEKTSPGLGDISVVKDMILYPFMRENKLEARKLIHD